MGSINVEHLHIWSLGAGATGLAGSISDTLVYYADATTQAAATETVSVAEIGSDGDYSITYTPESVGVYKLHLAESTLPAETYFEDDVRDAPEAAVDADSYCAEADVVALVQTGDYTGITYPTETQVLTFMQNRAAEIYGWMVRVLGQNAPGPANYATSIDTSTDAGLALSRVCRQANALGAAMDALESGGASQTPARSERVAELAIAYAGAMPGIEALAKQYVGHSGHYATHISVGEITRKSVVSRKQVEPGVSDATEW